MLVDFGMHQGGHDAERKNRKLPPLDAPRLDAVVLTHAHLDHCGRLPLLPMAGYTGRVWCTRATADLTGIILRDAAYVQKMDAERLARRRARRGRDEASVRPLYTAEDAEVVLRLLTGVGYGEWTEVAAGVRVRLVDAGHILGSASVEMVVREDGREKTVVFSGDIGPRGTPLLQDPVTFTAADLVVLESTYGDRDHRGEAETEEELRRVMIEARVSGGKVIVPAFAVGRTQRLIYMIGQMVRDGKLSDPKVIIDSPMAIATTELYRRHRDLFDDAAWAVIEDGVSPLAFEGLRFSRTAEESRALNNLRNGEVVIAASGMCTGGRVLHHLKHSLWKKETHVVIVGYQAEGTLGRRLVSGAKNVRVMGEPIVVKAQVHTIGGLSAHAGQTGLVEWASHWAAVKPRVVLTHGEDKPREALARKLEKEFGLTSARPRWGESVEV